MLEDTNSLDGANLMEKMPFVKALKGDNSKESGVTDDEYLLGTRQANLVLIAYASSEGSGEPAHPRSLARTYVARSYKQ